MKSLLALMTNKVFILILTLFYEFAVCLKIYSDAPVVGSCVSIKCGAADGTGSVSS